MRPLWIGSLPSVKTFSRFVNTSDELGEPASLPPGASAGRRTFSLIAYKTVADGISKLVTLAITVAAARLLSSQDFGILALATTTGWLLGVASDAGLPLYLAKRLARAAVSDAGASFAPVAETLRIRAMLGTIGSAVGLVVALAVAPGASFFAFWMIVVAQLLNAILETLAHAYRGLGRSEIESSIVVSQRLVTAVAAVAVLQGSASLLLLSFVLIVPPALALAVSLRKARSLLASSTASGPPSALAERASPLSHLPVGLGILLSAIYFRCDVFFIEHWHGLETVGVYNAAFRIVEALRLVPAAVLAVQFPAMCTARDARQLRSLLTPLVAISLVMAVLVFVAAPMLLEGLYGTRFGTAAPALGTLAMALPLFFANYALTHQVIAWDGHREYLLVVVAALAVNLLGNITLIPERGMQGAALATVATEVVVAVGCAIALAQLRRPAGARLARTPSRGAA